MSGQSAIRTHQSSGSVTRTFCGNCGSNLQFARAGKDYFSLAVGSLDDFNENPSSFEIFTYSKSAWGDRSNSVSHSGDHGS